MKQYIWKESLKEIIDLNDNQFGHNLNFSYKEICQYISKLEKFGAAEIKIVDYYTIKFRLPAPVNCDQILLFILTNGSMPSEVRHKKMKDDCGDVLTLEWHY